MRRLWFGFSLSTALVAFAATIGAAAAGEQLIAVSLALTTIAFGLAALRASDD